MGTPLLIAYRYFWSGFDPDDFFTPLIAQATGRPAEPAAVPDAHVVVDSVFVPALPEGAHFACYKISKRRDEYISSLSGAFRVELV